MGRWLAIPIASMIAAAPSLLTACASSPSQSGSSPENLAPAESESASLGTTKQAGDELVSAPRQAEPAPAPEMVQGPPVDTGTDPPPELTSPAGPGAASTAESAPEPASPEKPRPLHRSDGRPNWWLDAPEVKDGRTTITAEALGRDVRSAIRAAVDAGRRALTERLSAAPTDERIEVSTVRALAAPAGGESSARYVGYVRMSGRAPTVDDSAGR